MSGIERKSQLGIPVFDKAFERELDKEFKKITPKIGKIMVKYAKANHRYKNRTGDLSKSIRYKGDLKKRTGTKRNMFLTANTDYANLIHDGFTHRSGATWAPDKFLSGAMFHTRPKIKPIIQNAIDRVTKRMSKQRKK